jgi:hypothetical protein
MLGTEKIKTPGTSGVLKIYFLQKSLTRDLTFPGSGYKLFSPSVSFVVRVLNGWVLHEIGSWGIQHSSYPAVKGQLAASNGIDYHTCRVRRVFYRKPKFKVHRHISKELAFHSQEADLVVFLPGYVVAGSNVNIIVLKFPRKHRLDSLCL